MLKVYGFPTTRTTRVTWMLEEIGAEYELEVVNLGASAHLSPEYLALNPMGKVPALGDGDLVISESAAICTYLGDRFPESGLVPPAGTPDRGRYEQWAHFVIGELEQPLWTIAKHKFALPKERRVAGVVETARWEFERPAAALDEALAHGDFVLGDRFSAVDVLVGHTLSWARKNLDSLGSARVEIYADRVLARPALERAREREAQAGREAGLDL